MNTRSRPTFQERLAKHTDTTDPTLCWLWGGRIDATGYGRYGTGFLAYRTSYEQARGSIPDGFEIDHLCRVRLCVNPAHLEAVTHAENMRRGAAGREGEVTCAMGHPFIESNTIQTPSGPKCRSCLVIERYQQRLADRASFCEEGHTRPYGARCVECRREAARARRTAAPKFRCPMCASELLWSNAVRHMKTQHDIDTTPSALRADLLNGASHD